MNKTIFLTIMIVIVMSVVFYSSNFNTESFEQKRERILNELSLAIDEAIEKDRYKCCIDPPCTMCYMGNWLWDDGSCYCDDLIMKGEFDKVCPQCIKGIEEGRCISTRIEECTIPQVK
ncbi:MAG: hypothetical protein GTN36_05630 [Candidatus Aenigmarchaeota archaeon]|nr:hypothetical protein [Candidatus Aenigmarchaeota archaeon]